MKVCFKKKVRDQIVLYFKNTKDEFSWYSMETNDGEDIFQSYSIKFLDSPYFEVEDDPSRVGNYSIIYPFNLQTYAVAKDHVERYDEVFDVKLDELFEL